MAIEDDKTYGLTGAQVKDLVEKINSKKGYTEIDITDITTTPALVVERDLTSDGLYLIRNGSSLGKRIHLRATSSTDAISIPFHSTLWLQIFHGSGSLAGAIGMFYTCATTATDGQSLTYKYLAVNGAVTSKTFFSGGLQDNLAQASHTAALSGAAGWQLARDMVGARTGALGSALAWTPVGTGSSYTKRALQITLNISETGLSIPAGTWTSLGITLPQYFQPSIIMFGSIMANNGEAFEAGLVRINTDGTVEVYASNAVSDVHGSIVFPVAS